MELAATLPLQPEHGQTEVAAAAGGSAGSSGREQLLLAPAPTSQLQEPGADANQGGQQQPAAVKAALELAAFDAWVAAAARLQEWGALEYLAVGGWCGSMQALSRAGVLYVSAGSQLLCCLQASGKHAMPWLAGMPGKAPTLCHSPPFFLAVLVSAGSHASGAASGPSA